ncbi:MAG: hypothetical protein R3B90_22980 [Planctomycetaceae bacterium]
MHGKFLRTWMALVVVVGLVVPAAAQSGTPQGGQPARFAASMSSANALLDDLRWVVVELAGENQVYEEILVPSTEVFLYGVDLDRPAGMAWVFAKEGGARQTFQIPLEGNDPTVFRQENLEPIDILSRRRGRDLYELDSPSLDYQGWMRIADGYGLISTVQDDVPATAASAETELLEILAKGNFDLAGRIVNTAEGIADRTAAFKELRENMLAGVTRRPTETQQVFALRESSARHQADRMERMFVQTQELLVGGVTDSKKGEARGELLMSGLPGTELAKALGRYGTIPSHFSAVPAAEGAILSARVRLPIDEIRRSGSREFNKLFEPVWMERIDKLEDLTADQKSARKELAKQVLAILTESMELDQIDAFIDVAPLGTDKYAMLGGVRTADGGKVAELLKGLPAGFKDIAVELNVAQAGEAHIHRIKFTGTPPKALTKFYGEVPDLYVATQKEAVWLAVGSGAIDRLTETIAVVAASEPKADGIAITVDAHLSPIVLHLDELAVETGFDLKEILARNQSNATDEPRRQNPLAGIDLRSIALPVLRTATLDRIEIRFIQADGAVKGTVRLERDLIKATGKIIAKVAAEKLGG